MAADPEQVLYRLFPSICIHRAFQRERVTRAAERDKELAVKSWDSGWQILMPIVQDLPIFARDR